MKKQMDIFILLKGEVLVEKQEKIKLTHCLQSPGNTMLNGDFNGYVDSKYVNLGKHGDLDKILCIAPDEKTVFYLGYWNDGVI